MKLFTNKISKGVAVMVSACIVCGTAAFAYSANPSIHDAAEDAGASARQGIASLEAFNYSGSTSTAAASDSASDATTDVAAFAPTSAAQDVDKDETVYVIADAQGATQKIIVSDELKNAAGDVSLTDKSELQDIKNLKSTGNYTKNSDGTLTWDAEGKEIYYQGTSDKALPVSVKVTYQLDGKTLSASELVGKSGKVTIRYDYSIDKSVVAQSKDAAPAFLTLTGIILDNAKFTDISVSNGKIVDDGDRSIVIGFALPGIGDALGSAGETGELPEYVEISASVQAFSLGSSLTYASCDFANSIDSDKLGSVKALSGELGQISSAVTQLTDGSSALYEGLSTLLEKSGQMTGGIDTLYSGASSLSAGLSQLDANSAALKSGAYQAFSGLTSAAQTQLNAALTANGMSAVTLTPATYSTVLGGLLDSFSGGAYTQATTAASAKIRPQVEAAVRQQVTAAVKESVKAGALAKGYTDEQAEAYVLSAEGAAALSAYVEQKMASDEIKQTIESNLTAQLASAEVKAQIDSAVSSGLSGNASYSAIKTLKDSLDSYAAFYSGLSAYTAGVSSASNGAQQVTAGLGQLKSGGTGLVSGVQQLRDGAMQLSDGMNAFVSGLTSKLGNLSDSQLSAVLPSLSAMFEAAKSYDNYSGIAEGMTGSVRFVIKTAAIGE